MFPVAADIKRDTTGLMVLKQGGGAINFVLGIIEEHPAYWANMNVVIPVTAANL